MPGVDENDNSKSLENLTKDRFQTFHALKSLQLSVDLNTQREGNSSPRPVVLQMEDLFYPCEKFQLLLNLQCFAKKFKFFSGLIQTILFYRLQTAESYHFDSTTWLYRILMEHTCKDGFQGEPTADCCDHSFQQVPIFFS